MSELTNPRQTALISCRGKAKVIGVEKEKDDIITLDWHMPTSISPRMYAISIGKTRFSYELIHNSKVFVVNFMSLGHKDAVLFCGRSSGRHMNKFKESGLSMEEADNIDCCRIKEAAAFIECEVVNEIDTGDHVIFIGKVMNSDIKTRGKRIFHVTGDTFTSTVD